MDYSAIFLLWGQPFLACRANDPTSFRFSPHEVSSVCVSPSVCRTVTVFDFCLLATPDFFHRHYVKLR